MDRRTILWGGAAAAAAVGLPESVAGGLPGLIRVGIIGVEGHTGEITDLAAELPAVQVTAVAESQPDLLASARRRAVYRKAAFYDDYRALLDREKLDVVAVCGRNGDRAAALVECAARKIPIVAEKPLTITLADLEAVRKAVTANRVPITMLLPMRFYPAYQAMRNIVSSGEVGEVVSIAAQKSYKLGSRPDWMKRRSSYGGTIPYIGPHMVDLMRWVTGREFTEASAFHANVDRPELGEMENTAVIAFRLDNRGTASLRLDYLRPETAPTHGDDRLRIAGTKGVVEYQQDGLTLMTGTRKPAPVTDLPAEKSLFRDFLESLYSGKPHLIRPEDVFRVTEIVLKARDAADGGRVVRL